MPPASRRWNVKPRCAPSFAAALAEYGPLLAQLLHNRAVGDPAQVAEFFTGDISLDPFGLRDMELAVERIRRAIKDGERIVVYGDFDADGVTATVLLSEVLGSLGADVQRYIPHRVDEGYGLNSGALDRISESGAGLVVTVDCGIRSVHEVSHAVHHGMDVIVTDHHTPGGDLPPAIAVINPKRPGDSYVCKDLAGVGLAYKLAQALLLREGEKPLGRKRGDLSPSDLLDLVALGTVADVAPLLGENRSLVQTGLKSLARARRPGVRAMFSEAGVEPASVDATTIGFVLAPRINAAGRLGSARLSYRLLTATDPVDAQRLAAELGDLNRQRQSKTLERLEQARAIVEAGTPDRFLHLVCHPDFEPGIVGLVAGRLAEERYRPVLVVEQGPETSRGSGRSIPEFDITAALDECSDLLERYGGHPGAAGFTVRTDRLTELSDRLEMIAERELEGKDLRPALDIDAVVVLGSEVNYSTAALLRRMEPCGAGNPPALLAARGLTVTSQRLVGSKGEHLKLTVRDPRATGPARGFEWEAIAFRQAAWAPELGPGSEPIDLAFTVEEDHYGGRARVQLVVKDIGRGVLSDGE